VRPDSLAQVFIDSYCSASCKMNKNIKEVFMPEFLQDVNQYHRKSVGYLALFYNYFKLYSIFVFFEKHELSRLWRDFF